MFKRLLLKWYLPFILFILMFPRANAYVSVSPIEIFLIMDRGTSWRGYLNVTSSERWVLEVKVSKMDYVNYGTKVELLKPSSSKWSCSGWIYIPLSRFELLPNSTFTLPFEVKVPEGVKPGDYHALILLEVGAKGAGGVVSVKFRIGALVAIRIPGKRATLCKAELISYNVSQESLRLTLRCLNEGNSLVRAKPIVLTYSKGVTLRITEGFWALVYPGYWYQFELEVPLSKLKGIKSLVAYFKLKDAFSGEESATNLIRISIG